MECERPHCPKCGRPMRFLGKINRALRRSTAVYRCDDCKEIVSIVCQPSDRDEDTGD